MRGTAIDSELFVLKRMLVEKGPNVRQSGEGAHTPASHTPASHTPASLPLILPPTGPFSCLLSGLREAHFGTLLSSAPNVVKFMESFPSEKELWLAFLYEVTECWSLL